MRASKNREELHESDDLSEDSLGLSVDRVVALARHASMSSSYKPALLKALLRIVRSSTELKIPLETIGAEFLRLYWVQTVVFRLRQAPTLAKEPEVVQAIRREATTSGVRRLADLPAIVRLRLEREIARTLPKNVLGAFHKSKPEAMGLLYQWHPLAGCLLLEPESFQFLRDNNLALESVANLWWARYLERVNMLAPLIIEKVERQDAKRGSLARYLDILRQVDVPNCFYCDRILDSAPAVHIDHVIPWSFLLEDPVWDLVLACSACNLAKSDTLPDRHFLDKLSATHRRRAAASLAEGSARAGSTQTISFILPSDIERFYDAALAVEWPYGWSPS